MNVTAQSWLLGAQLRRLREQAGLTAKYVAETWLQRSTSFVYSVEGGYRTLNKLELEGLVSTAYGRPDAIKRLEDLRSLVSEGKSTRDKSTKYPDSMMFHELQTNATQVFDLSIELVPSLCQNEEYSMAMMRMAGRDNEESQQYTKSRLDNQVRLLSMDSPPDIHLTVTQGALDRAFRVDGQIAKLVERAEHPAITLRMIPTSAGVHMFNSSFTVLRFLDLPSILFHDLVTGGELIDDNNDVEHAMTRLAQTEPILMSAEETLIRLRHMGG
jgi:hypothetical protein